MTTCPRCGRVADEVVCADCGMSLALARRKAAAAQAAGGDGATAARAHAAGGPSPSLLDELVSEDDGTAAADTRMWRLGALVCITCVLAAATAIVLLRYGRAPHRSDAAVVHPTTSAPATRPATRSAPPRPARTTQRRSPTRRARSDTPRSSSKPRPPAKPVVVGVRSTARSSTAPAERSRAASPTRSVHLARGALDPACGPHCYTLVVTLGGFGSATQHVTCWSGHDGAFGSYRAASATSAGCSYRHPHDAVWVVVDGRYRSNTVTW